MKKRRVGLFFALFCIGFMFFVGFCSSFSGSGAGTLADPYVITNCTQLQEMNDDRYANYSLGNNIDCSDTVNWNEGAGFIPISTPYSTYFMGSFDGRNYSISNLYIYRPSTDFVSLFAAVYNPTSVIKNVAMIDVNITGAVNSAGLVGWCTEGTVNNSYASGYVVATTQGGGLVGAIGHGGGGSAVYNSYANVTVRCTSGEHCGGFTSLVQNSIVSNCYAEGSVSGISSIGGFTGTFAGTTISNSYSLGNITSGTNDGGFVGKFDSGTCTNNYYYDSRYGDSCSSGSTEVSDRTLFYSSTHDVYDSNEPYWDFTSVWQERPSSYPILRQFSYLYLPSLSINSPSNGSYYNSTNITVNFSASDAEYVWYNNGTANSTAVNATEGLVDYFIASGEGQYNFTFYANDSEGGISSEEVTFYVDMTFPLIDYGEGTEENDSSFARNWVFVNVSINETNSANLTFYLFDAEGNLVSGRTSGVDVTEGLVGYWPMDESSGSVAIDYSGRGNNGTLTNTKPNYDGKVNKAYYFDGDSDYVTIPNNPSLSFGKNISVSLWMYNLGYSGDGSTSYLWRGNPAISQYAIHRYQNYGNNKLCFVPDASAEGAYNCATLPFFVMDNSQLNKWIHVVGTYNGNTVALYINGSLYNSSSYSGNVADVAADLIIGWYYNPYSEVNGYLDEIAIWNRSLSSEEVSSIYNEGTGANLLSVFGSSLSESSNFSVNFTGLSSGTYYYNVTLCDLAGNCNSTETRKISIDADAPSYSNLSYSPNYTLGLDPDANITISLSIQDVPSGVASVILYYNYTLWNGTNSSLISSAFEDPIEGSNYSIVLRTELYNSSYSFFIFMNDSLGNEVNTSRYNFTANWDCAWNITSSKGSFNFGSIGGFNQFLELGNLTVINWGDSMYHINNCSLTFTRNKTSGEGWYEGGADPDEGLLLNFSTTYYLSTFQNGNERGLRYLVNGTPVTSVTLNASENATIQVKAYFPMRISGGLPYLEERIYFPVEVYMPEEEEELGGSSLFSRILRLLGQSAIVTHWGDSSSGIRVSAKMVITPGAYLESAIEGYSSRHTVDLSPGDHHFRAYVQNLVDGRYGSNNTAYNVSLNWTLPEEISTLFVYDNLTLFNETLNNTDKTYLDIILRLDSSNVLDLEEAVYTINTSAFGYENSTGELVIIDHASGEILEDSLILDFRCPPSYYEGEKASACIPPVTTVLGSSGGGGGGGASVKQERSEAEFWLVIGGEQEFQLPIKNKYPLALKDLRISVDGINSEFIYVVTSRIDEIPGNSEKNITVKILAPAYFREGEYQLKFKIDGFVQENSTKSPYTENKFVTLYMIEMSIEDAKRLVEESREMVQKMNESGFYVNDVSNLLKDIESSFNSSVFSKLKREYSELKILFNSAFEGLALRDELNEGIETAEKNGVSVIETKKLVYLAEAAFERGAYKEALERFKEAKLTYAVETKGEFNILYYVKNNPLQALGILIGISLFGYGGSLRTRYQILKRRLRLLKQEQVLLLGLMKVVQRECFELAHMSMEEYDSAMSQYEERLSQAVEEEIRAETSLTNLGKIKGRGKALTEEKKKLIELLKGLQEKYLVKGELETRIYNNMVKSYSRRLVEVEEEMTFLEAKEYLSRKGLKIGK